MAIDKKELFEQLERASNQSDLESTFNLHGVKEVNEKKQLLLDCKGLQSFYSPGYHNLSPEEQYDHEVAIFLEGTWKLKKMYAKLRQ